MVQLNPEDIERPFVAGPMRRMGTMVARALLAALPQLRLARADAELVPDA